MRLSFRKQVFKVKAKESLTYQQTSERFAISTRTLFCWEKRLEPSHNKPATKIDRQALAEDVRKYLALYQRERAKQFGGCQPMIHHALKRLNVTKNTETS